MPDNTPKNTPASPTSNRIGGIADFVTTSAAQRFEGLTRNLPGGLGNVLKSTLFNSDPNASRTDRALDIALAMIPQTKLIGILLQNEKIRNLAKSGIKFTAQYAFVATIIFITLSIAVIGTVVNAMKDPTKVAQLVTYSGEVANLGQVIRKACENTNERVETDTDCSQFTSVGN